MNDFSALITALDQTTKTNQRLKALNRYLEAAPERDILWAVALFTGRRPRRPVNNTRLREWAAELAEVPLWLFEDSYHVVGDLAETISLILPERTQRIDRSLRDWMLWLIALGGKEEAEQKAAICDAWMGLTREERFVFNKLMTGAFRIGVSQKMMVKALANYLDRDEAVMAHRLSGKWDPENTTFDQLLRQENAQDDISKPYPFYLAYQLEDEPENLGQPHEWQAEWKWDGIRGQVVVRNGEVFIWSRGEELVTEKYPEYHAFAHALPDGTVIDGEILAFRDGAPMNFNVLQTRIGRKSVSKKLLQEAPVVLMAYDLLEHEGKDLRTRVMQERRSILEKLIARANNPRLLLSPTVDFRSWDDLRMARSRSRERMSEGIMLKHRNSEYKVGRKRGDWWKWKVDPLTIDAVMIYAMRGHGRRANLYTDYTFAVWKGEELVPFTKAYSGLTDEEFRRVDAFVKRNTLERFGPVRSVKPELVFEIAFEGIAKSTRHKSGVALRFPRMKRWREDKPPEEANTLDDLNQMLEKFG